MTDLNEIIKTIDLLAEEAEEAEKAEKENRGYVTITLDRYNELIRKEVIYDVKKHDLETNTYDIDKILFGVAEKKNEN